MSQPIVIETSMTISFQSGHFLLLGPSGPPVLIGPDSDCWIKLRNQLNLMPVLSAPCCICKCGQIHSTDTHLGPSCE